MKCYEHNNKINNKCELKNCRYWISNKKSVNCCIVLTQTKNTKQLTLQEIGKIFNVTRMRICQIEKMAIEKLKNKFIK